MTRADWIKCLLHKGSFEQFASELKKDSVWKIATLFHSKDTRKEYMDLVVQLSESIPDEKWLELYESALPYWKGVIAFTFKKVEADVEDFLRKVLLLKSQDIPEILQLLPYKEFSVEKAKTIFSLLLENAYRDDNFESIEKCAFEMKKTVAFTALKEAFKDFKEENWLNDAEVESILENILLKVQTKYLEIVTNKPRL